MTTAANARKAERVMRIIDGFAGECGLIDRDLAAICRVTPQTFSTARRRDPGSFKLDEILSLARAFGCKPGEILDGQKGEDK